MPRFAQLVIGPAGSGKSTYCSAIQQHGAAANRNIDIVNLDPAAEYFAYKPFVDIRELIQVENVMQDEDLLFGPNGGLIYCLEFLMENLDWLKDRLGDDDNDYILFDCPGQIELYTHLPVMKNLVERLRNWDFNICSVYLLDAQHMNDGAKFLSGTMAALSVMVNLVTSHINIISKMDLVPKTARKQMEKFLVPDAHELLGYFEAPNRPIFNKKYHNLTEAIGRTVEDYSLVKFIPLNIFDHENLGDLLITIDSVLQFDEEQDVKTKDFDEEDPDQVEIPIND